MPNRKQKALTRKEMAAASSSRVLPPPKKSPKPKKNTLAHPKPKDMPKQTAPSSSKDPPMEDEAEASDASYSSDLTHHTFVFSQEDEIPGPERPRPPKNKPKPKQKNHPASKKPSKLPSSPSYSSSSSSSSSRTPPPIPFGDNTHITDQDEVDPTLMWDPLAYDNFCNMEDDFIVPEVFPSSFPIMGKKGKAAFYHDGFIFACNDATKYSLNTHHYKCEGTNCKARLTTYGFQVFKEMNGEHTCFEVDNVINRLLKWYLVQRHPFNRQMSAPQVATNAMKHLTTTQKITCDTHAEITRFVRDYRKKESPTGVSPTKISELDVAQTLRVTPKQELFLQHDDGIGSKKRMLMFGTNSHMRKLMECDTC